MLLIMHSLRTVNLLLFHAYLCVAWITSVRIYVIREVWKWRCRREKVAEILVVSSFIRESGKSYRYLKVEE
jgi:hypothetical protein